MTIKQYLYLFLAALAIGVGYKAYDVWNEYQALKVEHQILQQNELALKDSISMQAAKMVEITSYVKNLETKYDKVNKQYTAVKIENSALIDTIKILKKKTESTFTDSSVTVAFEGKEKIVYYKGSTLSNLKTKTSIYNLVLSFDTVKTSSFLFRDENQIWKIRSVSQTDGVNVLGISTIDDGTFNALQKYSPPVPPKNLGIGLQFNMNDLYGTIIFRVDSRFYLGGGYKLNDQKELKDNVMLNIHYMLF